MRVYLRTQRYCFLYCFHLFILSFTSSRQILSDSPQIGRKRRHFSDETWLYIFVETKFWIQKRLRRSIKVTVDCVQLEQDLKLLWELHVLPTAAGKLVLLRFLPTTFARLKWQLSNIFLNISF